MTADECDKLAVLHNSFTLVITADYQMSKLVPNWGQTPQPGSKLIQLRKQVKRLDQFTMCVNNLHYRHPNMHTAIITHILVLVRILRLHLKCRRKNKLLFDLSVD